MPTLANSTFLDLTSYGTTTVTTVEAAYGVSGGGGDRDFNDLIVQLDFTGGSGHGWLI